MKKEKTIEEMIYEETETRLNEMASPDYEFPERMPRRDYWAIGIAVTVSICLIISVMIGGVQ